MKQFVATVEAQRVVAIVRELDGQIAVERVRALLAAGVRVVEVSLTTPGALEAIATLRAEAPAEAFVGVGTALTTEDVKNAMAAGAQFVVAPNLSRRVVRACSKADLPVFPGVATPTEAVQAIGWGATAAKIFPASLWTPAALRDVRAALPQLRTVPTGGVGLHNAADWIEAGAWAVGVGSALTRSIDPELTARELIASLTRTVA